MKRKLELEPQYFSMWRISIIVPLLKLKREKRLFYVLLAATVLGDLLMLYGLAQGNDIFYPLGREVHWAFVLVLPAYLATVCLIFLCLSWPLLTLLPSLVILSGIGLFGYEVITYLRTAIWDAHLLIDILNLHGWINQEGELPELRQIVFYATNWTPLFACLIVGGIWLYGNMTADLRQKALGLIADLEELRGGVAGRARG
jgi:hypothetical protein